jgi:hypothetical protein
MASPFPGMNPYLEQNDSWEDFHHNFISRAQEMLERQVGEHYFVKVEVRLYLHELSAEERRYFGKADVGVATSHPSSNTSASSATLATAPVQLTLPAVEVERHSSLEVRDRRNRRVVTVIELLSPSNKTRGEDAEDYMAKRREVLGGLVHLVEIDLRRGGQRPSPPELPQCDYYALVSRYEDRPRIGVWPIALREPLPTIPVPLSAPDADVSLDLQELVHRVYDAVNYGKYIYTETPDPPLSPQDQAWARQFVPTSH